MLFPSKHGRALLNSTAQPSFCMADRNLARGTAATGSLPPSQPYGFPLLTAAQLRWVIQDQIWPFLATLCPGADPMWGLKLSRTRMCC